MSKKNKKRTTETNNQTEQTEKIIKPVNFITDDGELDFSKQMYDNLNTPLPDESASESVAATADDPEVVMESCNNDNQTNANENHNVIDVEPEDIVAAPEEQTQSLDDDTDNIIEKNLIGDGYVKIAAIGKYKFFAHKSLSDVACRLPIMYSAENKAAAYCDDNKLDGSRKIFVLTGYTDPDNFKLEPHTDLVDANKNHIKMIVQANNGSLNVITKTA